MTNGSRPQFRKSFRVRFRKERLDKWCCETLPAPVSTLQFFNGTVSRGLHNVCFDLTEFLYRKSIFVGLFLLTKHNTTIHHFLLYGQQPSQPSQPSQLSNFLVELVFFSFFVMDTHGALMSLLFSFVERSGV